MDVFDFILAHQVKALVPFLEAEATKYNIPVSEIAYIALISNGGLRTALVRNRTLLHSLSLADFAMTAFNVKLDEDKISRIKQRISSEIAQAATKYGKAQEDVLLVIRGREDGKPSVCFQTDNIRHEEIPALDFAKMLSNA